MVDGSLEPGEAPWLDKKEPYRLSGPLSGVVTLRVECVPEQNTTLGHSLHLEQIKNPSLSEKHTGWATNTCLYDASGRCITAEALKVTGRSHDVTSCQLNPEVTPAAGSQGGVRRGSGMSYVLPPLCFDSGGEREEGESRRKRERYHSEGGVVPLVPRSAEEETGEFAAAVRRAGQSENNPRHNVR